MDTINLKELSRREISESLPKDACCKAAFLSAAFKASGRIRIARRRLNLILPAENYAQALAAAKLLKDLYPVEFEISAEHEKSGAKKGGQTYSVIAPSGLSKQIITDLGLMSLENGELNAFSDYIPKELVKKPCCKRAYLKGLFASCGSVYAPGISGEDKKTGYHFELRFEREAVAESVREFLSDMGFSFKISERGNNFLVYIKDKDEIFRLLGEMGLYESALTLKAIIDERETANGINRASICEAANLDKTFIASSNQLVAIGLIEERDGLESLTQALRETALARLENPEASMSELADLLGVSKSCLNHRLRKLVEIAG